MATTRSTLSRHGRLLRPLEPVTLANGTVLPVGVYQALIEAYVEMMRQKGVMTAEGTIDPSALLDTGSVLKARDAARRESTVAPRPRSRSLTRLRSANPPTLEGDRPSVPVRDVQSFEGRYNRVFGDPGWLQVDVDARASADGSGSGGHLGAELGLGVTLPGIGRKTILKEEMNVAVLWDQCSARTAIDTVGAAPRITSTSNELRNVSPWESRQTLGVTRLLAFGAIPVNLPVNLVAVAGVSCRGTSDSAYDDMRTSRGILQATLAPTQTAASGTLMEGAFARLELQGSAEVAVSLRSAVSLLSQFEPELHERIKKVLAHLPGLDPWSWSVGSAGASISVQLASLQLRAEGSYSLDFFHNEQRGGGGVVAGNYVQSGAIDARLSARVLIDPSIRVRLGVASLDGTDVAWESPAIEGAWPRLGEDFEVWGWREAVFDREVSVLEQGWRVDLGPGARATPADPVGAANGTANGIHPYQAPTDPESPFV